LERRTALVARELAQYKVDIAALSETRFSEQGQLEEVIPPSPSPSPYPPGCSDNPRSNRPERRTALVARELAATRWTLAALSETRFSEQGQLEDVGAKGGTCCSQRDPIL
uniref:Endo/exonuclease/phosphatase domain-containing protein n=1 Tax=Schistocephalus solidus TaxID=70667 RepID=A0A183TUR1_SCHSO